jgi:hypothetical protein
MRTLSIPALALTALSLTAAPQVRAQAGPGTYSSVRAINLARNTTVKLNGGLTVYRPAACMFNTDFSGGSCLVQTNSDGYLYKFLGGAPGWQQLGLPATTETELLISPDGRTVVNLLYNGAPR